uniref:Uncharacterized protein n=1 Tax=Cacopsylla melanoneura TaxID=428564 RepID=A0A8D8ZX20_9HEMI
MAHLFPTLFLVLVSSVLALNAHVLDLGDVYQRSVLGESKNGIVSHGSAQLDVDSACVENNHCPSARIRRAAYHGMGISLKFKKYRARMREQIREGIRAKEEQGIRANSEQLLEGIRATEDQEELGRPHR